jgi:NAD(P)-dependent dehydrogenase (short-subunit alcohol dehydrogenase family)
MILIILFFYIQLGATVIIASRSIQKCKDSAELIKSTNPDANGKLVVQALDISDLDDVMKFVHWYQSNYSELHFLVNNAGMMYLTDMSTLSEENPLRSKQGYDLCFATNFMGHYLLTEKLLPLLLKTRNAKIVNISSSVHLQVDGSDLIPVDDAHPYAARGDVYTMSRWLDSYGNSKLAQIYHTIELQQRINQIKDTNLKVYHLISHLI